MREAGALGGRRVEFSPEMVTGRAGYGAVRPGAGVSTEPSREHHDRSPSGVAYALSALKLLLGAAARLLKRDHRAIQDRPAEDTLADASGSVPRRDGFAASRPGYRQEERKVEGKIIGIDMYGAWVRRLTASLFLFAALGTNPAGAATIEVWSATLTPTNVGSDLGCINGIGNPVKACSTATVLSDDDFTYDSTDYAVSTLSLSTSGNLTIELDTNITTATKGLTLVVSDTSLAFVDATASSDRLRVWASTGLSWTTGTAVGVKLISTNTEPTAANGTVTTGANTEYRFAYADFNYRDADRDRLSSVKIVTLPAAGKGTLKLDNANVSAGDTVTRSELDTGKLTYAPPSSGSGSGFASFTFKVNDGTINSATYTMTIDVTATPSHCTSPQSNELWCATMTVGNKSGSSRYGYNRFTGTGSITPDRFTHNGKTFVVNGPSNHGNPAQRLRFVLGRYFDPDYSTHFHECLLSRLGSSRLTLEFGTGGNKKTAPLVVEPGPQVHFDMYPYAGNWASGDTVQVKLLRMSSPGAPAQSRPVATAVRSMTSDYAIDVSWTAVTTVCGQPVEAYEIQVSEDGTDWRTLVRDTNNTALTYTHSGLPAEATRHYRVQAAVGLQGTGSGSGFGQPASATTAAAVGTPCGSVANEIWCAEMTVGTQNNAVTGFHQGDYGSLSREQFNYGGTAYRVQQIRHDSDNRHLFLSLRPFAGNTTVNKAGFQLRAGTSSYSFPADATGPDTTHLQWTNVDPGWSVGDRVTVRLTGPASGRQVVVDPPTVTSTPAVSESGPDGQWSEGETVEVTIAFSEAVELDTNGGTPSVTIALSGTEAHSAGYLRGSGTEELVFGYTLITGDGDHTVMAVTPNSLALNGGAIRSVSTSVDAALEHNGTIVAGDAGRTTQRLTAHFEAVPENHDGTAAFNVELRFSAEPEGLSYSTVQGRLLEVQGGSVTRAARTTKGSSQGWRVTVTPSGDGDVEIRLPARSCDQPNAICVGGRALAQDAEAMVSGTSSTQPPPEVPVAASFSGAPAEHDGTGSFELRFRLSEEPSGLSYRTVRNGLFDVSGGTIGRAWRLQKGNNAGWGLRIEPSGLGDVTLGVHATTDCAGTPGVCTSDGRMLGGGLQATIAGPPTLSVADAEVDEGSGATLDFEVTLNRALNETVTVGYRTVNGSASAGADYTSTSGTLTFAAQETSKTVSVPVLDDIHDEGAETLTLRLQSPAPTRVKLADAEATGTINNTDAMPQAWLARFGRTVGEHAMEAVEARLQGPRTPGLSGSIGGQQLSGLSGAKDAAAKADEADTRQGLETLTNWLSGKPGAETDAGAFESRSLSGREVLTGSAFAFTGGTAQTGLAAFWGRGAVTRFDGREGELTLDGEVASAMLGADFSREAVLGGLMLSHSRGEGGYRSPDGSGEVESTLTAIFPYARYALSKRVSVWGMAGYGEGTLTLTPEGQAPMRPDMDLLMGAVGVRGVLVDGGTEGPTLAAKSDAMTVRTSTGAVTGLAGSEADVTRLRLALEGSQPFNLGGDAVLTPSLELGVRHDGGDAETGFGADIGAGLILAAPSRGLSAELRARGLLTHEADGLRERGVSGTLAFDPAPDSDRGLSLNLSQTVGVQAAGGTNALLARPTLAGLGAEEDEGRLGRRLDARLGYGLAVFDDGWTATPEFGLGLSDTGRELRLGARLTERVAVGLALELGVEATRRENADGANPRHGLGVGLGWQLTGEHASHAAFEIRFEAARLEAANDDDAPENRIGITLTARW